jgi:HD-GYP domain-containing protein (c-di-GMP phosphodiesterase class II)/chloramphenicol O-acetyltransferase
MDGSVVSDMNSGNIAEKQVVDCTESDILATDVISSNGCKLLSVNTVITDYIKIHLGLNHIQTIRVYNTIKSETENSGFHFSVVKDYRDTMCNIKRIITNLSAGHPLHHDEIVEISDSMVKNMDIRHSSNIIKYMSQIQSTDQYTYTHSVNVAFYSMLLAKWLGLSEKEISLTVQSGLLHDLGKTKIPAYILKKKGPLSTNEFSVMKTHPLHSCKLLSDCPNMDMRIKEAALLHHERLNGSGYPLGLTSISLLARIVAIADVYDAMTSNRVYKKGVTPFKAFEYFQNEGASLFDWHMLNIFTANMSAFFVGSSVKMTSGVMAKIVYIPPDHPSRPVVCINSASPNFPTMDGLDIANHTCMNNPEFNHEADKAPESDNTQFNSYEAKEAIKTGRNIKEYANLIGAKSTGGISNELNESIDQTHYLVEDLYEKNKDWVDEYLNKIKEIYPNATEDEIKDSYFTGLDRFIKRQYRTYKKESPAELQNLNDNQYLRSSIFAFTNDYIQLAKLAQRTTDSPNTALGIATNANLLSPTQFRDILTKYTSLGDAAINRAAVDYSSNPEKFLDDMIVTVERVKADPKYAALGEATINKAAINYSSNPEKFLDGVIVTVERLKADPMYTALGDTAMNRAAINYPSNPEKFLDGVIVTVERFKADLRYTALGDTAINKAAINYSSNPKKFLDDMIVTVERVKADPKYAALGDAAINRAAVDYSSNPEKFLDGAIETIDRLKANPKYTTLGDWAINRAAINYSSNPKKFLDGMIETTERLKSDPKYSVLGDRTINTAAINYLSNPEKFLDGVIETIDRLKANPKYTTLGDWAINRAAINYPSNPEKFLDD